jgi:hypothetical protein
MFLHVNPLVEIVDQNQSILNSKYLEGAIDAYSNGINSVRC